MISENRENGTGDSEMIARDPEWRHIAVAVTFEAGNVHLIQVVCEANMWVAVCPRVR